MEKFARGIVYVFGGLVIGALVFCAVALLPFLKLDPQVAAYWGAGIGAVAGIAFGAYRGFA